MYIFFNNNGEQIGTTSSEDVQLSGATSKLFNKDFDETKTYALVDGEMIGTLKAEPTKAEMDAAEAEYQATKYRQDRQYPSIGDQLDALFHAGVFPQEMAEKIQAVKDAHPKPTGE